MDVYDCLTMMQFSSTEVVAHPLSTRFTAWSLVIRRYSAWDDSPRPPRRHSVGILPYETPFMSTILTSGRASEAPPGQLVVNDGSKEYGGRAPCIAVVPSSSGGNQERTLLATSFMNRNGAGGMCAQSSVLFFVCPRQRILSDALHRTMGATLP